MRIAMWAVVLASCTVFAAAARAQNAMAKPSHDNTKNLLLPPSEDLVRAWEEIGGKLGRNGAGFSRGQIRFQGAEG